MSLFTVPDYLMVPGTARQEPPPGPGSGRPSLWSQILAKCAQGGVSQVRGVTERGMVVAVLLWSFRVARASNER
ncbi:hypothetical protein GCM10010394_22420 [Streptomyces crystallinus]|uniref:Uncharacterized protein n=1 Tax=Streptomyces crystallinus TaxID=68191 RepID=A0ABP3QKQ1_9ACTN